MIVGKSDEEIETMIANIVSVLGEVCANDKNFSFNLKFKINDTTYRLTLAQETSDFSYLKAN